MQLVNSSDKNIFHSTIDSWLIILLVLTLLGSLSLLLKLQSMDSLEEYLFASAFIFFTLILPSWVLLRNLYEITNDNLIVGFGPLTWHIPYKSITKISHTTEASLAPALSFHRIKIHYGINQVIMISPKDENHFLNLLKRHVQDIEIVPIKYPKR
ncbi:PH domain-containing protein [Psychrobium sp. 1_MG-2023]|uniref:PH domain-containing protein n=1 Tax=Psychrobium sp. 1_MG-2023 TaxID=3062624 RepID=UPI002735BDDB|nr:PH domain-containing protein [Psychrobium sp. 1_MG-2023]MDP2560599.1 PH domain-containing protein [Psychrobium sp. 1_MG-2023]